ncbi:ABC-three component system protein [Xanthomarina gelatinilytica]|uniref:ABC-three component system protein n=1 Tax=Xanthomarina gelatinilytica TaxID=1137281 RepID=UPI003AA8D28A
MKQLIDPNDIHTAAATWSGFIYQGKIALYHTLYLINNDPNSLDYSVQLDSLEDFAIVKININGDILPVSLHQVKAMKSNLYSSYNDAFDKLEKRLLDFPCNGAYFHLSTQNEKTVAQIKALHPTIDLYMYGINPYCKLEEIDKKCEEQIEIFLDNNALNHQNTNNNVLALRKSLEAIINGQIISIHACNHMNNGLTIREGAYHLVIPFSSFKEVLIKDPETLLNEEYFLFMTKDILNINYTSFCTELDLQTKVSDVDKSKLDKYLQQINSFDSNEMLKFLISVMPHREVDLSSIMGFKEKNISGEEFKDAFLTILFELVEAKGPIGQNLLWNDEVGSKFTATAISSGLSTAYAVCKRIYQNINNTDIDVPYETDALITSDIDVDNIIKKINIQHEVEAAESLNNVTKWSKISLVSLPKIKNSIK